MNSGPASTLHGQRGCSLGKQRHSGGDLRAHVAAAAKVGFDFIAPQRLDSISPASTKSRASRSASDLIRQRLGHPLDAYHRPRAARPGFDDYVERLYAALVADARFDGRLQVTAAAPDLHGRPASPHLSEIHRTRTRTRRSRAATGARSPDRCPSPRSLFADQQRCHSERYALALFHSPCHDARSKVALASIQGLHSIPIGLPLGKVKCLSGTQPKCRAHAHLRQCEISRDVDGRDPQRRPLGRTCLDGRRARTERDVMPQSIGPQVRVIRYDADSQDLGAEGN